jgi:hypothetical protein
LCDIKLGVSYGVKNVVKKFVRLFFGSFSSKEWQSKHNSMSQCMSDRAHSFLYTPCDRGSSETLCHRDRDRRLEWETIWHFVHVIECPTTRPQTQEEKKKKTKIVVLSPCTRNQWKKKDEDERAERTEVDEDFCAWQIEAEQCWVKQACQQQGLSTSLHVSAVLSRKIVQTYVIAILTDCIICWLGGSSLKTKTNHIL